MTFSRSPRALSCFISIGFTDRGSKNASNVGFRALIMMVSISSLPSEYPRRGSRPLTDLAMLCAAYSMGLFGPAAKYSPLAIAKGRCDLEISLSWHLIKSYDIDVPGWERTRVYFTWIVTTACFYLIRGATLRMRVRERKRNREKRATTTVLKQTEAKITIQKYD